MCGQADRGIFGASGRRGAARHLKQDGRTATGMPRHPGPADRPLNRPALRCHGLETMAEERSPRPGSLPDQHPLKGPSWRQPKKTNRPVNDRGPRSGHASRDRRHRPSDRSVRNERARPRKPGDLSRSGSTVHECATASATRATKRSNVQSSNPPGPETNPTLERHDRAECSYRLRIRTRSP